MKSMSYIFLLSLLLPITAFSSEFPPLAASKGQPRKNPGRGQHGKKKSINEKRGNTTPLSLSNEKVNVGPESVASENKVESNSNPATPLTQSIENTNQVIEEVAIPVEVATQGVVQPVIEQAQLVQENDAQALEPEKADDKTIAPVEEEQNNVVIQQDSATVETQQVEVEQVPTNIQKVSEDESKLIVEDVQKEKPCIAEQCIQASNSETLKTPEVVMPLLYGYAQTFMNWKRGVGYNLLCELKSRKFDRKAPNTQQFIKDAIQYFIDLKEHNNVITVLKELDSIPTCELNIAPGTVELVYTYLRVRQKELQDELFTDLSNGINAHTERMKQILPKDVTANLCIANIKTALEDSIKKTQNILDNGCKQINACKEGRMLLCARYENLKLLDGYSSDTEKQQYDSEDIVRRITLRDKMNSFGSSIQKANKTIISIENALQQLNKS